MNHQSRRSTWQRRAVLEAIRFLDGQHPTAAEVFAHVREAHPRLSLATVYRALAVLTEERQVMEIRMEGVARYDAGMQFHHHIICRQCGTVADVCDDALPVTLYRKVEKCSGYVVADEPIQFYGLCSTCAALQN
jgi:Fe2+ or Zn2+ uptake regulation protein